ncbi:unnamed protein product [Vitrella brassicaformis CCMP3155]|uniref:Importin N-terminal domain-containing protein n=1 Tax=Vitrella brassicaformis (strain CCMP3155) TaxID=1169540 RepID=A0A0G4G6R3_VITBC|nr:unnamed protein product [Vitrella brassicaformis CCMP3155]|eukprot:CEM24402.1 unnamed protein product [Vitrella brassicaformis CCMP3155]
MAAAAAFPPGSFTAASVEQKLMELWQTADESVRKAANTYLMSFQDHPDAWLVAQQLAISHSVEVQYIGLQTLYWKIRRHWSQAGDKQADLSRFLLQFLEQPSRMPQNKSRIRVAHALSAIVVRTVTSQWPTCIQQLLQIGSRDAVLRLQVMRVFASLPEELDASLHTHVADSAAAQALKAHLRSIVDFVASSLEMALQPSLHPSAFTPDMTDEQRTQVVSGLKDAAFVFCSEWAKTLSVPLLEHAALSRQLVRALEVDQGDEGLTDAVRMLLTKAHSYSCMWAGGPTITCPQLLEKPGEGPILRCLLTQLQGLVPRLQQLCGGGGGGGDGGGGGGYRVPNVSEMDGKTERVLCAWARVLAMLCEGYTQLVMDGAHEYLMEALRCFYHIHPRVAENFGEIWSQMKEMSRGNVLSKEELMRFLTQVGVPAVQALIRHCRRDNPMWDGAHEDHILYIEAAQDCIGDIYLMFDSVEQSQGLSFLESVTQEFVRTIQAKDVHGMEVLIYVQDVLIESNPVLSNPTAEFFRALAQVPPSRDCAAAASNLLQKHGHLLSKHGDIVRGCMAYLMQNLPVRPEWVAQTMCDMCMACGHHLLPSLGEFLAVVERTATQYSVKADTLLLAAVVHVVKALPAGEVPQSFARCLQTTTTAFKSLDTPPLSTLGDDAKPIAFRHFHRTWRAVKALAARDNDDSPQNPGSAKAAAGAAHARQTAAAVRGFVQPVWPHFARVCRAVLVLPVHHTHTATVSKAGRKHGKAAQNMLNYELTDGSLMDIALLAAGAVLDALGEQGADMWKDVIDLSVSVISHHPSPPPQPPHPSQQHHTSHQMPNFNALKLITSLVKHSGASRDACMALLSPRLSEIFAIVIRSAQQQGSLTSHSHPALLAAYTPVFELLVVVVTHVAYDSQYSLYASPYFPMLLQLATQALSGSDIELLSWAMQFIVKCASTQQQQNAQQHFAAHFGELVRGIVTNFHNWSRPLSPIYSKLFSVMLEKYNEPFVQGCTQYWQSERARGVTGPHTHPLPTASSRDSRSGGDPLHRRLSDAQLELVVRCMRHLRGPKLKLLLQDLHGIANGSQTADALVNYEAELAAHRPS